jgi:hypothetical protein
MIRIRQILTSLVAMAMLSLPGCGTPTSNPSFAISSSGSGWNYDSDDPIPGVHNGSAKRVTFDSGFPSDTTVVVWCDRDIDEWHGNSKENGAVNEGHFQLEEGARVDFRFQTVDGTTMSEATIDGQTYDADDGLLFLISTQSDDIHLKQLDVKIRDFPPKNPAENEDSSLNNSDIVKFFTDAKKKSNADQQ